MGRNKKKYLVLMLAGVIFNFFFYGLARLLELPIWMNNIGTCYVSMMLEPAAGLLVGYVYNFYEALVIYGPESMIYYSTTAIAALSVGVLVKKDGRIRLKRLPGAVLLFTVINTFVSCLLTIWRTGGDVSGGWEEHLMMRMMAGGLPEYPAFFLASLVYRMIDLVVFVVLLSLLYCLTPKKWREED